MIKIIIVTGFLGSGKTTFLKSILKDAKNVGLIINEFGKIGIDDRLLQNAIAGENDSVLVDGGCFCCNKINGLKNSLCDVLGLFENKPLEYVVIETTGLANVAPMIYTILNDVFLSSHFMVYKVITCVDALNYTQHIQNQETLNQIFSANEIVVTKLDLCESFSKDRLPKNIPVYFKKDYTFDMFFKKQNEINLKDYKNEDYAHQIDSVAFEFNQTLDWNKFSVWLSVFLFTHGEDILRIKGVLDVGEEECVSVNGVYHHMYPCEHIKLEQKTSNLVIIFKNLDKDKIVQSFKMFLELNENTRILG